MKSERPFSEIESHRLIYANSHRLVTAVGRSALGIKVYGQHHIPMDEGALIAANHRHWLDIFALPSAVPERHVSMVARHDSFETPVLGKFFELWQALPIHRGEATRDEMRAIIERLKSDSSEDGEEIMGRLVGIFPEETREKERVKDPHEIDMKEFKPGVAWIAHKAGVLTVPAALYGMDNSLRVWKRHRGVVFGKGMEPPGKRDEYDDWIDELRTRMEFLYRQIDQKQL